MSHKRIKRPETVLKPILLSDTERARLAPFLAEAVRAQGAYRSAMSSATAITATIGERAGFPTEQKFQIAPDMAALIPVP